MRYLSLLVVLFIGVLIVFNGSCAKCGERVGEKATERMIEATSGGRAKVDVGSVDISSLPANFRYPNAVAKAKWEVTTEEGKGINYSLETTDPKEKVVEFYKTAFAGWHKSMISETPDGTTLAFSGGDNREAVVILVSGDKTKTTIALMHTKK